MKDIVSRSRGQDTPVLSLHSLTVDISTRHGTLRPVDDVSWDIAAGEILGVVGESGAGKSMAGNAVIGLLDPPAHISSGQVLLKGERIDGYTLLQMRKLRGKRIGMVFQDPLTSLNPLLSIGAKLEETILRHLEVTRDKAAKRAIRGWTRSAFRARKTGWGPVRTSSPAGCASGS